MLQVIYNSCERVGPGLLAESLNLATGVVILLTGLWFLTRSRQPELSWWMALQVVLMGMTALLSHAWPNVVTEALSVVPIVLFFAVAVYAYARDLLSLSHGESIAAVLIVLPFVAISQPLNFLLDGPAASAGFAAMPVFMLGIAVLLRQRDNLAGLRVLGAAGLLAAGLVLRAADKPLCAEFPFGTHALWHVLATIVVAILICTYRRHLLAAGNARG